MRYEQSRSEACEKQFAPIQEVNCLITVTDTAFVLSAWNIGVNILPHLILHVSKSLKWIYLQFAQTMIKTILILTRNKKAKYSIFVRDIALILLITFWGHPGHLALYSIIFPSASHVNLSQLLPNYSSLSNRFKGTKWAGFFFWKKDSFYVILKRKYSFRQDSNPRSMGCEANDLPLSYLTCWWMGIKIAYIKDKIRCFCQSGIRNCHKVPNCEQFRTKCCVKISATLKLASTHVFLIKMCQEC